MNALLSVAEARTRLLAAFSPVEDETVHLSQAVGRVLAKAVRSNLDLPPFANSSMDGFAVKVGDVAAASVASGVRLRVIADLPAGRTTSLSLAPGQAIRIMTGAVLPEGAEAVVPVEDTDLRERQPDAPLPQWVTVYKPVRMGENVRPKGQDVRAGEIVMRAGQRLRPQDVGFLAMLGVARVSVYRLPRVAVLATGDELIPVDRPLEPGKIYDSNSYTLTSQIARYGGQPLNLGIVPDEVEAICACLDRAVAEKVDLILSSAGVSVGAFDFVRQAVERKGRLEFWRVNMRPGKPLAFGYYQGVPFVGLPGNPVSAFVGFEVFVRPALMKMSGLELVDPPTLKVRVVEEIESDGRESFLRAVVTHEDSQWIARLTGHQGSGNLRSLVQANALLLVPSGVKSLPTGAEVEAWLLD